MDRQLSLQRAEQMALEQVKFCNIMLQEIRRRNEILQKELGMTYAKYVGLTTPYEEAIFHLRKVKKEFDEFLGIVREDFKKEFGPIPTPKRDKRIRSIRRSDKPPYLG